MHHRRSIRLKDYDYTKAGAYFVTICTWNRECLFGDILDGKIQLNEFGQIVDEFLRRIHGHFRDVKINEFIIMPNHFHGIMLIESDDVGAIHELPLRNATEHKQQRRRMLLPKIIGWLKMNSAKCINQIRNTHGVPVWQKNYYEHIIRNEDELNRIREYIINNPLKWTEDENNPANIKGKVGASW
jgi:REP element-mobilizing transposase RayT